MTKPQRYLTLCTVLAAVSPALLAQPDRIAARIDNSRSVELTGRVPRQATAKNDAGPVDPSFVLPAITLVLKPSATQQADLNRLLLAQQDAKSADYRKWLTPEQYADRFGVSAGDLAQIGTWLEAQGFTVGYTARARNFVSFRGTAQQVASAFHTQIHTYNVDGKTHYANRAAPAIPAALSGLVSAIRGLNDFRLSPRTRKVQPGISFDRQYAIGPADFAAIYDVTPLYNANINGTGQGIMIVGQSEILTSDINTFRNRFGLGLANLQLELVPTSVGGGNPGFSSGDETESDLDVEWSGAVAKDATVYFVYSMDVWDSAFYAIDRDFAPVMSMSYGICEQADFVDLDSERSEVQQANAEGITFLGVAGDSAAADCDEFNQGTVAEGGLTVDAPASIPEVTAMGGTEFNEGSGNYWNDGAATGYIPEAAWNETAVSLSYGGGPLGTGGGVSAYFTQPPWQNGIAPNDGMRHVPDISSAAAVYHDGYYIFSSDEQYFGQSGANLIGGTSCAAPSMAGIVALLNQYLGSTTGLGNINPTLYRLQQTQSGVFHDIVNGNNIVPCADSPDCQNGSMGYSTGPGYDSASGLGSVDAYNLVHQWNTAQAAQAIVVPSLDSTPEYETAAGSNQWTFTLTLNEEGGFATTVGALSINGVSLTPAQIVSMFGTAAIPANGSISGPYSLQGLDVSNGPVNVVFTLSGGTGSATWSNTTTAPFAGPLVLAVNALTNAASYQQLVYAPGMLMNVWGAGMDFDSVPQTVTTTPLPFYVAGITAYVYNLNATGPSCANTASLCYPAPLLYVSPNQLNVQIPYELNSGAAEIAISTPWNYYGQTFDFVVYSTAPGIFSYADTGTTSSPIGSGSAHVGDEVAIYVTGSGTVSPLPGDGMTPDSGTTPVLPASAPLTVTVNNVPVTSVVFAGIPSWSVGVMQINFTIPNGVPAGQQPVLVTIGNNTSLPENITIAP